MLAVARGERFVEGGKIHAVAFPRKLAAAGKVDDLGGRISDISVAARRLGSSISRRCFVGGGGHRDGFAVRDGDDLAEQICPVDRNAAGGQAVQGGFGWMTVVVVRADADDGVLRMDRLQKFGRLAARTSVVRDLQNGCGNIHTGG